MPSNSMKLDRVQQISERPQPAFSAVIVDRDSMSGLLLAAALARDLRCDAVGIQPNSLIQMLASRKVDLVILSADISSRPGGGLELAKAVYRNYPDVPILILLDQPLQMSVLNAFRSGARGIFNRQGSMSEFSECVERVRKGCLWADGEETSIILKAFRSLPAAISFADGDTALLLTTRESQVVRLAAIGMTNKTIASELGLSEHTVKNYLFRVFEKLGVSSRVELLFYLSTRGHSISRSDRR